MTKTTLISSLIAAMFLLPATGSASRGKFRPKLKRMEQALIRGHHVLKNLSSNDVIPIARSVEKNGRSVEILALRSGLAVRINEAGLPSRVKALHIGAKNALDKDSRAILRSAFRGNEAVLGKKQIAVAADKKAKASQRFGDGHDAPVEVKSVKHPAYIPTAQVRAHEANLKQLRAIMARRNMPRGKAWRFEDRGLPAFNELRQYDRMQTIRKYPGHAYPIPIIVSKPSGERVIDIRRMAAALDAATVDKVVFRQPNARALAAGKVAEAYLRKVVKMMVLGKAGTPAQQTEAKAFFSAPENRMYSAERLDLMTQAAAAYPLTRKTVVEKLSLDQATWERLQKAL